MLKEVGCILLEVIKCLLWNIFGDERSILMHKPLDLNAWPKTWNDKIIWCPTIIKLSKKHENEWEAGHVLNANISPLIEVPPLSYGLIYNITFNVDQNKKSYQVIIGDYSSYNCVDVVTIVASSLRRWGKWV